MSNTLRTIRVISDCRPGHENQSAGLATALARRTGAAIHVVRLAEAPLKWITRFPAASALNQAAPLPDLLIGAGHRAHLPLAFAARRFRARAVVIMRPTWPVRLFDLCLIPAHDCAKGCKGGNVIQTRGALNRIPEDIPTKQERGMVLIGGPSKHHGWDANRLAEAVSAVVAARPELSWVIGDSFRTPGDFLDQLRQRNLRAELVAHAQTTPEWLPSQLLAAQEVWVTEDSVSMLHEAVTAGARTGLLPMPTNNHAARPLRAVQGLVRDGFVTTYEAWKQGDHSLPEPKRLNETARCADIILQRFFPKHVAAAT
jgi:mitochondrial fission protein ELM1